MDFQPLIDLLKGFLQALFYGIVDFFVSFLTPVVAAIPNPPFTFADAINTANTAAPGLPLSILSPYFAAVVTILVSRVAIGIIRTAVKGWI